MARACDLNKKNKLDPVMRRYILGSAAVFGIAGLVAGYYYGLGIVSNEAVIDSPLTEKLFLNSFIAVSAAAAFMIFGAFVGSTIYRFKERSDKNKPNV